MKIEIVTDTFVPDVNGVAMTLGRLTEGLRKRGHQVHVIHTGISAKAGETCVAAVPLPGYKEVRVGLPKPFELRARWLKKRPDAIYVRNSPTGGPLPFTVDRGISHYYRKNYNDAVDDLTRAQKLDPEIPNIGTFVSMAKKKATTKK